ncbi:AP2 domain-containing protein [Escherichia coli]|nr:AP2 domain-containing protein [Escherichia coli]
MNIHKFIDLNEVIASNHPLANGTTDSVTQVIVAHLKSSDAGIDILNAPKVASDMSASFLNDLKSKYRVVTGRNSEGHIDAWLAHKHSGRRVTTRSNDKGYRAVNVNGRPYQEHRLIMALFYDVALPGWVVVNHAVSCTIWNEGKSNHPFNLRLTTAYGNQLDKKVREGVRNKFTGYHFDEYRGKWRVQMKLPFVGDLKHFGYYDTEAEAYIVRCAVLHKHLGSFWAVTTGESGLIPRVKPDGSLVLPAGDGYDWAEPLGEPEDWDDEFKDKLMEMHLYCDAYCVFGIEGDEDFGDFMSGLEVNAEVFNGVPAIIDITEGLPVSYAHWFGPSQRFEFNNYYQRCILACDLDAEPVEEDWMENDF